MRTELAIPTASVFLIFHYYFLTIRQYMPYYENSSVALATWTNHNKFNSTTFGNPYSFEPFDRNENITTIVKVENASSMEPIQETNKKDIRAAMATETMKMVTASTLSKTTDAIESKRTSSASSSSSMAPPQNTTEVSTMGAMDRDLKPWVLCIDDNSIYGRTCNHIIQIANSLHTAHHHPHNDHDPRQQGKLGLGTFWTERFQEFFDDSRDDVLLNYTGKCDEIIQARHAHKYTVNHHDVNHVLHSLIPKLEIRQAAEKAISELVSLFSLDGYHNLHSNDPNSNSTRNNTEMQLSRNLHLSPSPRRVVTVHRRWLEGGCHRRSRKPGWNFCTSSNHSIIVEDMCEITYKRVMNHDKHLQQQLKKEQDTQQGNQSTTHQSDTKDINDDNNTTMVILFTDGQRPDLDGTFPFIDDHPFPVQLWMMTLSAVHYGIPVSSVDHVVNHWRRGIGMQPTACYPPQ